MQTITGYRDGSARSGGIDFHFVEWGREDAPPLVLLHGLTGHAHIWDHMTPLFGERYRVLALDQRGHGDTSSAESYATADFVGDVEAMVEHWGLRRFDLMGLSMGGHNAIAYAAKHPEQVGHLIVIDIPPNMDRTKSPNYEASARLAETGHKTYQEFEAAVRDARAGTPTAPEENLRYRTRWNLRDLPDGGMMLKYDPKVSARWAPEDLTQKLSLVTMPTLLVRGGKTTVLPRDVAERMAAAIPNCTLVEVRASGHSVPTDRPEELGPIVMEWLSSADPA